MLYLIIDNNDVKVGYSDNLASRARSYRGTNPRFTDFNDTMIGGKEQERFIHENFFDTLNCFEKIGNTEWYHCNDEEMLSGLSKFGFKVITNIISIPPVETDNNFVEILPSDNECIAQIKAFRNSLESDFERTKKVLNQNLKSLLDEFKWNDNEGTLYREKSWPDADALASNSYDYFYATTSADADRYADLIVNLLKQCGFNNASWSIYKYSRSAQNISAYTFRL